MKKMLILDSKKNSRVYSRLKFGETEIRNNGQSLPLYRVSNNVTCTVKLVVSFIHCLVLVQPRKSCPDVTEKLLADT